MEISLRRASALQVAIREALNRLAISPSIEISIFANPEPLLVKGREKLDVSIRTRTALLDVLFDIRKKVGHANDASGISDVLADQARNNQEISFLGQLAGATPVEDIEVTRKRAERSASREDGSGHSFIRQASKDEIQVNILSEWDITGFTDNLRAAERQKTHLADRLSELNSVTRITLEPEHVAILEAEKLI